MDLLGDALGKYFQSGEAYRREGENLADYDLRHSALLRDMTKAMKEVGASNTVVSEIFGWFVLNQYLRLHPSDAATVKSTANSYKIEDVMAALRRMWGGESLAEKDLDWRRSDVPGQQRPIWPLQSQKVGMGPFGPAPPPKMRMRTSTTRIRMSSRRGSMTVWRPTWPGRRTRKSLRTSKKPGIDSRMLERAWTEPERDVASTPTTRARASLEPKAADRVGKEPSPAAACDVGSMDTRLCIAGSKARVASHPAAAALGFVFMNALTTKVPVKLAWQEFMFFKDMEIATSQDVAMAWMVALSSTSEPPASAYAVLCQQGEQKAILDSGASESIVGAITLQGIYDHFSYLGFDPEAEVKVDRNVNKSFIFGNNQTSAALGLAKMSAGTCGEERQLDVHVVDGATPLLLSGKWLYDAGAVINFKTGRAIFTEISPREIQLERAPSFHLMMPVTAFHGNQDILDNLFVKDGEDPGVAQLKDPSPRGEVHAVGSGTAEQTC